MADANPAKPQKSDKPKKEESAKGTGGGKKTKADSGPKVEKKEKFRIIKR